MATRRALPMVLALTAWLTLGCADAQSPTPVWSPHLRDVDEALARHDVSAALQAWHNGYAAALRSGTWIGLVEMGDAYLRIPVSATYASSPKPMARQAYLRALVRAQAQGSAQGTLLVALGFDRLDDAEVAAQCMKIAERLARRRGDADVLEQVMGERERLAWRLAARQDSSR